MQVDIGRVVVGNLPQAFVELPDTVVVPSAQVMEPDHRVRIRLAALDLAAIDEVAAA
jgi:hypothetical protein